MGEDNCSWHGFTYIRGWMQMVLAPNDLFSWNKNTERHETFFRRDIIYFSYNARDTHSVHNYLLKPWRSRLLCSWSSCYIFLPPLSGTNWCSLSLFGGPGRPTPKVASPFPGSTHTLSPGFRTTIFNVKNRRLIFSSIQIDFQLFNLNDILFKFQLQNYLSKKLESMSW
jgi:hypothetical protein